MSSFVYHQVVGNGEDSKMYPQDTYGELPSFPDIILPGTRELAKAPPNNNTHRLFRVPKGAPPVTSMLQNIEKTF